MALQDDITQLWVKLTGKRIKPESFDWLLGPIGDKDIIQDKFVHGLAKDHDLEVVKNATGSGLISSLEQIGIDAIERSKLNPQVIDFYEHTSNYRVDVWSEWKGPFKPFGWLLRHLFSKRLQQMNVPISPLDAALGMQSDIIQLVDSTGLSKYTVWYRILKKSKDVIYSGVYTSCQHPKSPKPLLKVVFPLPNGNATVIMHHKVLHDGSLLLSSEGKGFGDHGFYFTLTNHKGKYWAKFVRSMHEWIKVYEDSDGILRADHTMNIFGMRFMNLHYRMLPKADKL